MKNTTKIRVRILSLSLIFGLGTWFIDALVDYLIFYKPMHKGTFPNILIFNLSHHEIYMRTVILISFLLFGIFVSGFMIRLKRSQEKLFRKNNEFEATNEELEATNEELGSSMEELEASNEELQVMNEELIQAQAEREESEKIMAESLKEKEVLLKEIHHRVKNNMQVISSLLALQADYIRDDYDRELFNESHNRIHTMALVHEKLYQSNNMASINFAEYIVELSENLFQFYHIDRSLIDFKVDVNNIFITIDTAIPCAQIINELISNSLKYAFPNNRQGLISISLLKKNIENKEKHFLTVRDNGIGIPGTIDFEKTETLGMQMVMALARQLKGVVELNREDGTGFTITF
ncbi:MAG: hypothetical protein GY754_37605 [bacterium]|nr:hypothetical protein [bacterium]